jgi:hypothetical protein
MHPPYLQPGLLIRHDKDTSFPPSELSIYMNSLVQSFGILWSRERLEQFLKVRYEVDIKRQSTRYRTIPQTWLSVSTGTKNLHTVQDHFR